MLKNILSIINKGKRAKEITVVIDNSEYAVTRATRTLDKVQLHAEKIIPNAPESVETENPEEAEPEIEETETPVEEQGVEDNIQEEEDHE